MTPQQRQSDGPVWLMAALSFVPVPHRTRVRAWVERAPILAILGLQVVLTLRLHNVAFSDEGLYLNAGHDYLRQFSGGPPAPTYYGQYFSGFPWAYPVFGAAVDSVGGLRLARLVSLVLMLGATVSVGVVAARLAPPTRSHVARLVAMLVFVLTGPVLFVGNFATYDAPSMFLVIAGVALAIARDDYPSAIGAGLLLALAGICKYSAAVFIPAAVLLALLAGASRRRAALRAGLVSAYAVLGLLIVLVTRGADIIPGIELTTSNRVALNARPPSLLLAELARGIGGLLLLALAGLVVLVARRHSDTAVEPWGRAGAPWRRACSGAVLLAAGLAIPAGQLRLHEYVSFNKHLTFAALFLAPLAAQALILPRRFPAKALMTGAYYALALVALYRSDAMFGEWPDTAPVSDAIKRVDRPGIYLCLDAPSMAYSSRNHPELKWEEYWFLFGAGHKAIKAAVDEGRYAGIDYVTGSSGDARLDANTAYLAAQLKASPKYRLAGSWPKHQYDANRFVLYLRVTGVER